jgi:hypothetical protein
VLQIEFNRQSEDAWAKLIPAIEGVVVQDPHQVRESVQGQSAAFSQTPALNYTIGRANRPPPTVASPASTRAEPAAPAWQSSAPASAPKAPVYEEDEESSSTDYKSYPAPPTSPPPAAPPAQSNPFGDSQGTRKGSYAFTDEEGEGGEGAEEDVEEV